ERLRRAVEDGDAGGLGHVLEGAVTPIAEEPVGQALGLGDVDVVEAVAVEVAHGHTVIASALRNEHGVEVRGPVIEPRHELAAKRGVACERRLGHLGEDWGRSVAAQVVEGEPFGDAPGAVGAAPPEYLPAAKPLSAPAAIRGA